MGWTSFSPGDIISSSLHNANFNNSRNELGEVRAFALSETGAVTKANLQGRGWAICDGTTPAAQGISDADITAATPDLQEMFLRHSANETTGGTGGANSLTLTANNLPEHTHTVNVNANSSLGSNTVVERLTNAQSIATFTSNVNTTTATAINNQPAYYDICYFMKVKEV